MSHLKNKIDRISIDLIFTRQRDASSAPYTQTVHYESEDIGVTIASAIKEINSSSEFLDSEGEKVQEIIWEHSCLQEKCGACAMLIGGKPQLACGAFLRDYVKKGRVTIAPLRKFPVIADLRVDRSAMFENLKVMGMWLEKDAALSDKNSAGAFDSSRCLQCGCCLEVCPNVSLKDDFFGAAGFVPASRLISVLTEEDRKRVRKEYIRHSYNGCGKSLACMDICPADIDITSILLRTNASAFRK